MSRSLSVRVCVFAALLGAGLHGCGGSPARNPGTDTERTGGTGGGGRAGRGGSDATGGSGGTAGTGGSGGAAGVGGSGGTTGGSSGTGGSGGTGGSAGTGGTAGDAGMEASPPDVGPEVAPEVKPDAPSDAFLHSTIYPAAQNLIVAARSLEIGTCFTTFHMVAEPVIRTVCRVPPDVHLCVLVAVGYPSRPFRPVTRKPLESVLHWNTFG
jgi:hypothetical protein